ncbi:undecaprenyldiphospho-muramoylpentapeptide beta-N-acetylglucosaminyltransferase [Georgenia sp. MJ170]|uniref:undecaprenyldiphospho-muramoylpentapeptide beta-N-acetylglucosaminyltransferase n=1 Tax=Georgenia sunbinii TaxID=3117728 RepID=UPI002F263052
MAELRVLLAGGGTAGHVNPLLATAAELAGRPDGATVTVLGTAAGLESRLVPAAGWPLEVVPRVPLPRRPSPDLLRLPGRLRAAVRTAGEAIGRSGAEVVVGFGGYVATPAYLAARRLGVPVVVHEQNARPGLANRLGARWASAVAVSFAGTPLPGATLTGLPLRPEIAALVAERATPELAAQRRQAAAAALGLDPGRTTLLVTGGSLGAQRINDALAGSAQQLHDAGTHVLHLTGAGKADDVRAATAALPGHHVLEYLDDMASGYAAADLVLCRSGAGTVSELAALGIPAVYVPLPIGNGEQRRNAADVVAAGGGVIVPDAELTPAAVVRDVLPLLADRDRLAAMAAAAAGAGVRDGAARLADLVLRAAGREPAR